MRKQNEFLTRVSLHSGVPQSRALFFCLQCRRSLDNWHFQFWVGISLGTLTDWSWCWKPDPGLGQQIGNFNVKINPSPYFTFHRQVLTVYITSINLRCSIRFARTLYLYAPLRFSHQTNSTYLSRINQLAFKLQRQCVLCEIETKLLNFYGSHPAVLTTK